MRARRRRNVSLRRKCSALWLCKTTETKAGVGCPISTAGDTASKPRMCVYVCVCVHVTVSDLSGICMLKYGLCFSCV